jgi:hypothetical protein
MQSEEYQWGRHHRAIIAQHARSCPLNVHQLAERCGWANITAFQRHRKHWDKGRAHRRARIPIAYLNAIGIDWCELIRAVERDAVEYDTALEGMPHPGSVIINRRPSLGVTVRESLPHGLTDEERCSHIQRLVDTEVFAGCNALVLDWPGMKQVWFRAHQDPKVHLWRPRMTLMREFVDFGEPRISDRG